jgi:peptidoglycan/LPS O-acetylase OafA/YrhL
MTLGLGPLLWWVREGTVAGYAGTDPGPLGYLTGNWFTAMRQWGIGDLLTTTPYGHEKGYGVLNGSLWTLRYELFCYVVVGLLAVAGVVGVVRRRPAVVCWLAGVVYGMVLLDWLANDRWGTGPSLLPDLRGVPLLGDLGGRALFGFALVFAIGAVAAVRPDRFPVSTRLAAVAAAVLAVTLPAGGWDVAGAPAFAYLTLYAGLRAPRRIAALSPRADLSYGVYIYAFPIQQVLALLHLQRLGAAVFVALSLAGALVAGWVSWHVVERPALRLKDVAPPPLRTAPRVGPRHAARPALAGPGSADDEAQPAAGRTVALPAPRAAADRDRQVVAPDAGHGLVGDADAAALDVVGLAPAGQPHAGLLHHPAAGHVPGQRLALDAADPDVLQEVAEQRP